MVEAREAAWNRVNEQFQTLAEHVRQHYQDQDAEQVQDPTEPSAGEARDSVREALRSLGDAAERLASTVGDAIRDPQVKQDARTAGQSLVDAIGLTLSQIGGDLRARTERGRGQSEDVWDEPKVEVVDSVPDRPTTPTTGTGAVGTPDSTDSAGVVGGVDSVGTVEDSDDDDPQFRPGP